MEMFSISGLSGFIVGFGLVLILFLYQQKKGKKEHRFDERYETVHAKARSISWALLIVATFIMIIGSLIYEGPKLAFILLTALYALIFISYGIAVVIFNKKT